MIFSHIQNKFAIRELQIYIYCIKFANIIMIN